MSFAYIIASYSGADIRSILNTELPLKADYIKIHLEKLSKTDLSQIDQIILVKAKTNQQIKNFYDIDLYRNFFKEKLIEFEVPNENLSYGQWIKAIQKYPNFDYYFLIEDDYFPSCYDFAQRAIVLHQQKLPNGGYLASYCCETPNLYPNHAAVSNGLVDRNTFFKACPFSTSLNTARNEYGKLWPHGVCDQVAFSWLFKDQLTDMISTYDIPFWSSTQKKIIYMEEKRSRSSLLKPIQMWKDE